MDNKDKTNLNEISHKSVLINHSSLKNIKPYIEYVFLKENLCPQGRSIQTSTNKNSVKILIGKNRESVNKIANAANSLSKYNSKLNKLSDGIKFTTYRKEEELVTTNDKLETELNNKNLFKVRIKSLSRDKKKLEKKIDDRICLTNKLKENIDNIEDQVKLFEHTVKNSKENVEEKKIKYKEVVESLEIEVKNKRENCRELEELNKKLFIKIEELKIEEKKLKTDIIDEYKYLKEKSLVDKASIDDLIINITELGKKSYDYQIHFDKNFILDEKTGQYMSKTNSKLLKNYKEIEKQNNELKNQVQSLKKKIKSVSNKVESKKVDKTRNMEKTSDILNTVSSNTLNTKR